MRAGVRGRYGEGDMESKKVREGRRGRGEGREGEGEVRKGEGVRETETWRGRSEGGSEGGEVRRERGEGGRRRVKERER